MAKALTNTEFKFENQKSVYHGKVRDVYNVDDKLVMVATDRISAFDVVLPKGIPFKGQMLNQIAAKFLDARSCAIAHVIYTVAGKLACCHLIHCL